MVDLIAHLPSAILSRHYSILNFQRWATSPRGRGLESASGTAPDGRKSRRAGILRPLRGCTSSVHQSRPNGIVAQGAKGKSPPCITARWVDERSRKCREACFESEDGVVFRARRAENHPVCVGFGGFALILDDAATPPCGDARRGLRLRPL